jgi:hypothetical protein
LRIAWRGGGIEQDEETAEKPEELTPHLNYETNRYS